MRRGAVLGLVSAVFEYTRTQTPPARQFCVPAAGWSIPRVREETRERLDGVLLYRARSWNLELES